MIMKISVIIPCFNVEKYIDRCLDSVVNQTIGLDKLEILCVNDASTDTTWDKLVQWERQYSENVILINCEENGAQGRARNIALSYATGEYITFVDADDWLELDAYEKMYRAMQTYSCDIVRCGWIRDEGNDDIGQVQPKRLGQDSFLEINDEEERKKFLVTDIMGHICVDKMYTAKFIFEHQITFPEGCKYEDIYWGVMCYFYAERVYFLNEVMYHYFVNAQSTVMKTDVAYHMDRFKVVMYLWEECEKRGFLEKYPLEMELNFLIHFYLNGIKMMVICYSDVKYKEFQEICKVVLKTIPNYKDNPYIQQILPDMEQLQISLIDKNITKEEFSQVVSILQGEKI